MKDDWSNTGSKAHCPGWSKHIQALLAIGAHFLSSLGYSLQSIFIVYMEEDFKCIARFIDMLCIYVCIYIYTPMCVCAYMYMIYDINWYMSCWSCLSHPTSHESRSSHEHLSFVLPATAFPSAAQVSRHRDHPMASDFTMINDDQ